MTRILAALASVPNRPLERTLRSLRPQVDELAVYLNGYAEVPAFCRELGCLVVLDPDNTRGAEGKLFFADRWDGIYLACDDDFEYGKNYAREMSAEVRRWDGRALVTLHGRIYEGKPEHWKKWQFRSRWMDILHTGRWVNYGGTGVLAFDTRVLRVPAKWEGRNCCDPQLSVWAQRTHVPWWLRPHTGFEVKYLLRSEEQTIFMRERGEKFRTRERYLHELSAERGWKLYTLGASA